nr:acyl carrier protein [Paenibacillus xylanexedens]
MKEYEGQIRSFLTRYFRKHELAGDDDIFALGIVNSLFAMQLIIYIENEFGVEVANEDLNIENFSTIYKICSYIKSQQGQRAEG